MRRHGLRTPAGTPTLSCTVDDVQEWATLGVHCAAASEKDMATVLVVEDEDSLRDTLSRYLAREGHEVIAASSGDEALEAGFDAAPDLLIADWMLKSHIHGLHVSEVFRALNPRLHTILITGFPSRDLLEESDRCGVSHLLEKPFELWELQDAVDRALAVSWTSCRRGPPSTSLGWGCLHTRRASTSWSRATS